MAEYPMKLVKDSDLGQRGDKVILNEKQAIEAKQDGKAQYLGGMPEAHDFGERTTDEKTGEGYGPSGIKKAVSEQKKVRAASERQAEKQETKS